MAVITPLTDQECLDACLNDDLGPAVVVLDKYCPGSTNQQSSICIPCDEQRNDLTIESQVLFTDINTQCSQRTNKRQSGKSLMANISLGSGSKRMELLAAIFDTIVKTDPTDNNCEIVEVADEPGKCPCHWQVAILPIEGNTLITTFGIVLEYAIAHTEQFTYTFSPTTQREVPLSFEAELHPATGRLGFFAKSTDGEPCAILQNIANDCGFNTDGTL